jgi:rhomboid protease GluP
MNHHACKMLSAEQPPEFVIVFRGSHALCLEFGLVLEAKSLSYQLLESDGTWVLSVAADTELNAREEMSRYAQERNVPRIQPAPLLPFGGAALGAACYTAVLLLAGYCAGSGSFGADWYSLGALQQVASGQFEWWRALTALTLHVDQLHLFSNLLFGVAVGVIVSRIFGPGIAWVSILGAGVIANLIEMLVMPPEHRSIGASTAVFAALGLLSGFGWRLRAGLRERRFYRWAPLIAGACLLTLLGAGTEHVDVLGHLLGFVVGVLLGWSYARAGLPRSRSLWPQAMAAAAALLLLLVGWVMALLPALSA